MIALLTKHDIVKRTNSFRKMWDPVRVKSEWNVSTRFTWVKITSLARNWLWLSERSPSWSGTPLQ